MAMTGVGMARRRYSRSNRAKRNQKPLSFHMCPRGMLTKAKKGKRILRYLISVPFEIPGYQSVTTIWCRSMAIAKTA